MQLSNQQTLAVSQAQAWEALNDVTLLQQAIPGCESISPIGENQYEVQILAAIGPVRAKFKGKLALENIQAPSSYSLRFEGQGGAAGHGKGQADIRLQAAGANSTILHYTAQASVGGKIAQIGSRLVDMAAQKMAADFFANFSARLAERYEVALPALPPAPPEPQGFIAMLVAWFKRLVGG